MYNYPAGNRGNALGMWGPHLDVPYQFDNVIAKNLVTGSQVVLVVAGPSGPGAGLAGGLAWKGFAQRAVPDALEPERQ